MSDKDIESSKKCLHRDLHQHVIDMCTLYKKEQKLKGSIVHTARLKDMERLQQMCMEISCEKLLANRIKHYIKNDFYTARSVWTLFIGRKRHSHFRALIEIALTCYEDQYSRQSWQCQIQEMQKSLQLQSERHHAAIKVMKQSYQQQISELQSMICALTTEVRQLKTKPSTPQIDYLNQMIMMLQKENLQLRAALVKQPKSENKDMIKTTTVAPIHC